MRSDTLGMSGVAVTHLNASFHSLFDTTSELMITHHVVLETFRIIKRGVFRVAGTR